MRFGDFYGNLGESLGNCLGDQGNYGVFRMEMARIDEGQTQFLCVPEAVVLHIRGDEGIAARCGNLEHGAGAGTAAHCYLTDRLAAVNVAQALAAQAGLYRGQEGIQGLFLGIAHVDQTPGAALIIGSLGVHHFYIGKAKRFRQNGIDTAGGLVQVGVGIDVGDAVFNVLQ